VVGEMIMIRNFPARGGQSRKLQIRPIKSLIDQIELDILVSCVSVLPGR